MKLLLSLLTLLNIVAYSATFNATVVRVIDGDTIYVKQDKKKRQKIRLFGIDSPEMRQRDGAKPGRYLTIRITGKQVTIVPKGKDHYDRTLAIVYDEYGQNMNQEMVRLGLAWVYRRYVDSPDWLELESDARKQRIGIWRRKNPKPPWEYRKQYQKKSKR